MNKANFHFYIILSILMLSASIVNGQSAQTSSDDNSVADFSVKIMIDSLPDNILFPTTDSTIFMNLYKDCIITENAIRKKTYFIDTSKDSIMASFKNIPYGKYCLKILFMKFRLEKESINIELPSDSTFIVRIKPKTIYRVVVTADPEQYSLYGGYLKSKKLKEDPLYSFVGESDVMSGRIEFRIVGRKRWKIKLGLANENEDQFTEFGRRLSIRLFKRINPIIEDDTPVFRWIRVKKVKSQ